ncbi:MAG: tRNA pseudouridine(55) synthase TruB [Proteobacteria bacterium]|nr:tRNA pseudouridine(55) synthase TruB [Pseudomonadota bacterium]MBU1741869.1 tRNA pseudouridine(55) synthase TruB [Pseudomonadota bacterium]
MSRSRRRGVGSVHGVLPVDKPAGVSSFRIVDRCRRLLGAGKAGHTGTLDPFATGLLLVCLGEATKLATGMLASDKVYRATLRLGPVTDTLDRTGEVLEHRPVPELGLEEVRRGVAGLQGERLQRPPAYSAAKHRGRPLYRWARAGVQVDKPPKRVTVLRAELDFYRPGEIGFTVHCSAGTYVRVLGAELAEALGSGGHLTSLRRLRSGAWDLAEAIRGDDLESLAEAGRLTERLWPLNRAVDFLPGIEIEPRTAAELRQGRVPDELQAACRGSATGEEATWRTYTAAGDLVAVLRSEGRDVRIVRVFHPTVSGDDVGDDRRRQPIWNQGGYRGPDSG